MQFFTLYQKAYTLSFEDFILSFKDQYLELIWVRKQLVTNKNCGAFVNRNDYTKELSEFENCLNNSIKADYNWRHSILMKSFTQTINNFENSLSEIDWERIKFLNGIYLKIQTWSSENEEIIELKNYILKEIDEEIGHVQIGIEDFCSYNSAKKVVNRSLEELKDNVIKIIKNEIEETQKMLGYVTNFKFIEQQVISD